MFRWYQDSRICYAYLPDSDAPQPLESNILSDQAVEKVLERWTKCKWFTRGWTFQELIAPPRLHFFGPGFAPIARRSDLVHVLTQITGIPSDVLTWSQGERPQPLEQDNGSHDAHRRDQPSGPNHRPFPYRPTSPVHAVHLRDRLESYSIAQRMSWAARRITTRLEIEAYALLGIFDINMPMLYGEGRKAFIRLQEEIMKTSADHSILAWQPWDTTTPPVSRLLASSPNYFYHARGVIQRLVGNRQRPYEMTNLGLRIELLTVATNHEGGVEWVLAFLNCADGSINPPLCL
jgi:hypothetical protein